MDPQQVWTPLNPQKNSCSSLHDFVLCDAPLHLPHVWQSSLWKLWAEWQLQRLKPDVLLTFPFFLSSALFFLGRRTPSPAFDTVWTLTFASRHRTCCVIVTYPHRCRSQTFVCVDCPHTCAYLAKHVLFIHKISLVKRRNSALRCFHVVLAAILGFGKARHHRLFSLFTSLQQLICLCNPSVAKLWFNII